MQYSASGEADSFLANQQTLHILSNPKVYHMCNSLPHVSSLSQISPIPVCHPVSWRSVLMLSILLFLGLANGLAIWVFKTKALLKSMLSNCNALKQCDYHSPEDTSGQLHSQHFIPREVS
jgi:hypothetical protein